MIGETDTKVITPTNHNRSKQPDEPIRIHSSYLQVAYSFLLVEKFARIFDPKHSHRNGENNFQTGIWKLLESNWLSYHPN